MANTAGLSVLCSGSPASILADVFRSLRLEIFNSVFAPPRLLPLLRALARQARGVRPGVASSRNSVIFVFYSRFGRSPRGNVSDNGNSFLSLEERRGAGIRSRSSRFPTRLHAVCFVASMCMCVYVCMNGVLKTCVEVLTASSGVSCRLSPTGAMGGRTRVFILAAAPSYLRCAVFLQDV